MLSVLSDAKTANKVDRKINSQVWMQLRMHFRMQLECVFWPQSRCGNRHRRDAVPADVTECFRASGASGAIGTHRTDGTGCENREQNGQENQFTSLDAVADALSDAVGVRFLASIKMWRIHARLCVQSLAVFPLLRRYRRICRRCRRCRRVEKSRTKRKRSSKCKSGNTWGNAGMRFWGNTGNITVSKSPVPTKDRAYL